jgi:Protein of unknown function (DUF4031)
VTVYVDNARVPATVGCITARWSHLTADTREELCASAMRIGLRRDWLQTCRYDANCRPAARCVLWHFDVTDSKRRQALAAGAQPIDLWQRAGILAMRRRDLAVGNPEPPARDRGPDHPSM